MKLKKGGVRGNNKVSNLLNKPIKGVLADEKSSKFIFITLLITFVCISAFAINEFGMQEGLTFSFGLSVIGILMYLDVSRKEK
jgi:hypothetical protein